MSDDNSVLTRIVLLLEFQTVLFVISLEPTALAFKALPLSQDLATVYSGGVLTVAPVCSSSLVHPSHQWKCLRHVSGGLHQHDV